MSGKFSVIIPTMWYSHKIYETIDRLDRCAAVDEIILIDNNPGSRKELRSDKLNVLSQEKNIYVNPSWNLGVEVSENDYICISNDDITFSTDIFNFIAPYIDSGVYGMSTANYSTTDEKYSVGWIKQRPWGWGCLLFIHKKNWMPIDYRLKIACGDDWLMAKTPGGAYEINNLSLGDDNVSQTSARGEFYDIQQEDIRIWSQYLR